MLDTMKKLDETGQRILFIAPECKLKAVVTDGDIRKCILRGGALSAPLTQAANYHPHSLPVAERGRARAELQRLYAHLAAYYTTEGKKLGKGAVIGFAGSTGRSTGYHLHYEIRKNGRTIKPYWYGYDNSGRD